MAQPLTAAQQVMFALMEDEDSNKLGWELKDVLAMYCDTMGAPLEEAVDMYSWCHNHPHLRTRPVAYKKEFPELAFNYALLGCDQYRLAELFNIGHDRLHKWFQIHPELRERWEAGRDQADAEIAASLYHRAKGYKHKETKIATHMGEITDTTEIDKHYPPDTTAAKWWLSNRQPDRWKHETAIKVSGKIGREEMTDEEIAKVLAAAGLQQVATDSELDKLEVEEIEDDTERLD